MGAIFVLSLSATAVALPDAAKSFDEGLSHYRRHEYGEAAEAFFEAYKSSPTGDALYNAGLAWELAGDPAAAATAYELAATLDLSSSTRHDAARRLARLAPTLGRVEVSAPESATVRSGRFAIKGSRAVIYATPGRHRIRVSLRDGRQIEKGVITATGETAVVLVESSSVSDEDEPEAEAAGLPPKEQPKPEGPATPWSTLGWVSLGAATVAALGAVYFGVEAVHAKNEFDDSAHKNAAARDRAERNMHLTNICWAAAAVTGAAGVTMVLLAPSGDQKSVALSPRLMLRGSF